MVVIAVENLGTPLVLKNTLAAEPNENLKILNMTNKELAEQLRIAAEILETGKEWQYKISDHPWTNAIANSCPVSMVNREVEIRIKPWSLPEPPQGQSWNNSKKWEEGMLEEGERPLLVGEITEEQDLFLSIWDDTWGKTPTICLGKESNDDRSLYKTSRPLPLQKKELKFPILPEGLKWHNPHNLTPDQVGEGYRLLVKEEVDGRFACLGESFINDHGWANARSMSIKDNTYRVLVSIPLPQKIPFAPKDFPPSGTNLVRFPNNGSGEFWTPKDCYDTILSILPNGVIVALELDEESDTPTLRLISWETLMEGLVKRPGDKDFVPAYKVV